MVVGGLRLCGGRDHLAVRELLSESSSRNGSERDLFDRHSRYYYDDRVFHSGVVDLPEGEFAEVSTRFSRN